MSVESVRANGDSSELAEREGRRSSRGSKMAEEFIGLNCSHFGGSCRRRSSWEEFPAAILINPSTVESNSKSTSEGILAGGGSGSSRSTHPPEEPMSPYRYELMSEPVEPRRTTATEMASPLPAEAAAEEESAGASNRIKSIQEQIMQLRRQLESELSLARKSPPRRLNSTCASSLDCIGSISNSHCNLETLTCSCLGRHVEYNESSCLPPALLGGECLLDGQCQQKVNNSACRGKVCSCLEGFVAYRKDKCLPASGINNFCLTDRQCQMADRHSHCKWRIQNIYGTCRCPPNYLHYNTSLHYEHHYQEQDGRRDQIGDKIGPVALPASAPIVRKTITKCAPRLGDLCFEHQECLWATQNSLCRQPSANESLLTSWPTSLAVNTDRKCLCAPGFRISANRLACEPERSDEVEGRLGLSNEERRHAFGLLERGQLGEYQKFLELALNASRNRQPERRLSGSKPLLPGTGTGTGYSNKANLTSGSQRPRVSSLGKSCSSKLECQMGDKFSDCLNGTCECLRPTRSCSANSTGCHKETFQCRSGQCISRFFVCDHFKNCDDGSDEENCQPGNKCPPEAFACFDGRQCLSLAKLCNGIRDCSDGSDELHCSPELKSQLKTQDGGSRADDYNYKIAANLTRSEPGLGWNGRWEPASRRRPANDSSGWPCPARTFACADGRCLPGYAFCNAIAECADGSDERPSLCQPGSAREPSQAEVAAHKESTVIKTDRTVINELLRRQQLALKQQQPGSAGPRLKLLRRQPKLEASFLERPELGGRAERTRQTMASEQQECPTWAFQCANGSCRSSAILCSGVDGCGDNSDEHKCQVCQCEAP